MDFKEIPKYKWDIPKLKKLAKKVLEGGTVNTCICGKHKGLSKEELKEFEEYKKTLKQ